MAVAENYFFACPECRKLLKVPPGYAQPGELVTCPFCSHDLRIPSDAPAGREDPYSVEVRLPGPTGAGGAPASKAPADPDMIVICPECSHILKIMAGAARPGGTIQCPSCRKSISVPADAGDYVAPLPTRIQKRLGKESGRVSVPSPAKKPFHISRRWMVGAGVALVLTACIPAGMHALRWYNTHRLEKALYRAVAAISPGAKVTWMSRTVDPSRGSICLQKVIVTPKSGGKAVKMDRVELRDIDVNHGIPHRLTLEASGVSFSLGRSLLGPAEPAFRSLKRVDLEGGDVAVRYEYDEARKELKIRSADCWFPRVAAVRLEAVLSDVNEADVYRWLSSDPVSNAAAWKVARGQLEYRDESLLDGFMAYQAKYIGESVNELRQGMIQDIQTEILLEKTESTRNSLKQFQAFLKDWKQLVVLVRPGLPVSFSQVQEAYEREGWKGFIPALGLSFSTGKEGT